MVETSSNIQIVAAINKRFTIGKDGDIPWDIPEDMKRFKEVTYGSPVIMGANTYKSIGKPLPSRQNIVLSSQLRWGIEEGRDWIDTEPFETGEVALRAGSVDEALDIASQCVDLYGDLSTPISIIGGEVVYQSFIPLADRMHLTLVDDDTDGDTHFPFWFSGNWNVQNKGKGKQNGFSYYFVTYKRRSVTLQKGKPPLVSDINGEPEIRISDPCSVDGVEFSCSKKLKT